jgi:hypothetical protein
MFVRCDANDCEAEFDRNVTLPTRQDVEVNRVAAIINLAVAEGWQAVNTREPRTALTYCPAHHRGDVHAPCCSIHGHAMTCEAYRRTHFVEVRPCCGFDAAVVLAVGSEADARVRVTATEPGERLTLNMPREPNTAYAPSAAEGLVDSMTTLRLPDDTVRPVRVIDAVVLEGNLQITIEVEPGVIPAIDPRYVRLADERGEVGLGYYSIPERTPDDAAQIIGPERQQCGVCERHVGVYVPKGGDGSLVLLRNHNGRARTRCPGSKREPA